MGRCRKNCRNSKKKWLFLASLLSFWALSWYFLLPLVYYSHLTKFPLTTYEDPRAGPFTVSTPPAWPPGPSHQKSCPICLAVETFQDYDFIPLIPMPDNSFLLWVIPRHEPQPYVKTFCGLISGPRAPPISL